ncbi:PiggyBac transposable element-derived protein 1 [Nymphon striatum]|nr:PiggyBac transposable element-derived protein 1 [Nymphon striatum]
MPVELPLLNNVPSNLRELLQSYKEDVDLEDILRVDHFRVGYVLLLHSDAPKRKDYTGTVKKFVNIAEKNGLVNINVAALKSILAKLVTKIDGFKNFKRDYKNICCVCDDALKITIRNNLESPVPATPPTPVPMPATPPPPPPVYVPATPPLHVLVPATPPTPVPVPASPLTPMHVPNPLSTVFPRPFLFKKQRSTEPSSCRKRLKTDCDKCEKRCLAIAELKRKNDKKNNILREIRTSQKANKENVRPLAKEKPRKIDTTNKHCQSPVAKLKRKDKADVKALKRSRSKLKSDYKKKTLSNKNAEIGKLKARIRELEKEQFGLNHANDNLTATILEVQTEKQQLDTIASKSDKKTYGIPYRKAAYHCLSNQVPVETVSGVMNSVGKELTNGTLDGKADKSTISEFSYELGVLSDIQVAEVMVKNDNLTLAWDAASLDGEHINEVHVYIPGDTPKGYVLQISALPGGTTDDYNEHITNSIQDIVATYCALNKENEMTTLHSVRAHLKNTLCDRVAVNHCVVQKMKTSMDIELLQLKCNIHPLDGIASKSRSQLKKFDKDNDFKSDTFVKDCFAANLILGVSKMRYKQGTGDPARFKLFMKQEGIKPSTMVRYVGNRFEHTGIIPFNRDVFADIDFSPASVTDRDLAPQAPHPETSSTTISNQDKTSSSATQVDQQHASTSATQADQEQPSSSATQANKLQDNSMETHTNQPQSSINSHQSSILPPTPTQPGPSNNHVSPADILPLPKAGPRNQTNRGRKKGDIRILTDTPVRNSIANAIAGSKNKRKYNQSDSINQKGSSNWLTSIPLKDLDYTLNKVPSFGFFVSPEVLRDVPKFKSNQSVRPKRPARKSLFKGRNQARKSPTPSSSSEIPTPNPELSPFEFYKLFVTDKMLELIVNKSNKYAIKKDAFNLQLTVKELEVFFGMYHLMGLVKMPAVRDYWRWLQKYYDNLLRLSESNLEMYDDFKRGWFAISLKIAEVPAESDDPISLQDASPDEVADYVSTKQAERSKVEEQVNENNVRVKEKQKKYYKLKRMKGFKSYDFHVGQRVSKANTKKLRGRKGDRMASAWLQHCVCHQIVFRGLYWQSDQATLYLFAVYRREIKCDCYCVISDHLKHNQNVVHCFLRSTLEKIRLDLPHIKLVKYVSDGAASQYKNYKAVVNLIYHENDHKLKAEHNFFASHIEKSTCDGIGATIKREASNAIQDVFEALNDGNDSELSHRALWLSKLFEESDDDDFYIYIGILL